MKSITKFAVLLLATVALGSCDKTKLYDITMPPAEVHFAGQETESYSTLPTPDTAHTIYVGTTDIAPEDRTFTVTVSSPSGAVLNDQYTVSATTVTIPKGQTRGSFQIKADPNDYLFGRKDTLVIAFGAQNSLPVSGFLDTMRLSIRGICLESELVIGQLAGTYTKTLENGTYGPYVSTLTGVTSTGATSFKGTVTNIYAQGISAVVNFDYSDPEAWTIVVPTQSTGFTSGGRPLMIESFEDGTFTYCTNSLTINFRLFTSAGVVDEWQTTMRR